MGVFEGTRWGDVRVARLRASGHVGVRTDTDPIPPDGGHYAVAIALEGHLTVHQHDRTVQLNRGEVTAYDTVEEYVVGDALPFAAAIVMLPHDVFGVAGPRLVSLGATAWPAREGDAVRRAVSRMIANPQVLPQALAEIAASAATLRAPLRTRSRFDHDELRREARNVIERHLADPRLGPDFLAARLGVSRRLLYTAFVDVGPVFTMIRAYRLEAARSLLEDPANDDVSIAQLAASCGFTDPAHFSRLFRAAYHLSPREYRHA